MCIGDDDGKANGSRSAQGLPTGFTGVNQLSSGSPAQSVVSPKCMQYLYIKIMESWCIHG